MFRQVLGLECQRSENSGKRFWDVLKRAFGDDPHSCLKNIYIHNYCPLAFLKDSGRNITPVELRVSSNDKDQCTILEYKDNCVSDEKVLLILNIYKNFFFL